MQALRSDAIVVFGVTGDLVHKEIFPAIYGLFRDEDVSVPIIGVARSDWSQEHLIARARDAVESTGHPHRREGVRPAGPACCATSAATTAIPRPTRGCATRCRAPGSPLFYMAIPPSVFPVVTNCLAASGCSLNSRVVVEKPFGRDLRSARELNNTLRKHYPGGGHLSHRPLPGQGAGPEHHLHPLSPTRCWSPSGIATTSAASRSPWPRTSGSRSGAASTKRRAPSGTSIQNHLLQLLAVVAMDPPGGGIPDAYRDEKARVLMAVRPLDAQARGAGAVRGLPVGAGSGSRFDGGDLRGPEAHHRQLALGGRAHLHPQRQGARRHLHRGLRRVAPAAAGDLRRAGAACRPATCACASAPTS